MINFKIKQTIEKIFIYLLYFFHIDNRGDGNDFFFDSGNDEKNGMCFGNYVVYTNCCFTCGRNQ